MFTKILIVEDLEIANYGIIKTLIDKKIIREDGITNTQYCDKAIIEFKKAHNENVPFQLLITDLSFDKNHRKEKISSGIELIKEIRKIQSNIKIIVYSIENKPSKIKLLFSKYLINGYICKDGNDSQELINSINAIYENDIYISSHLGDIFNKKNSFELDDYQKLLLRKLADGYTQKQIQKKFQEQNITPYSISIIEKKLEKLRDVFDAKSTTHLITIVNDFGLI
ncbi:response regulator [uncultured Dokdonia sp.]|uniref:response regulator n=1 Tax=uncultured Dokdonia sp. TaxID=575653 RepID=UPI0026262D05|nr:response regulator [uncultured Dokdonia sp.]